MTRITATAGSVTAHFDTIFAAMIASCAEFCAGARQGRDTLTRTDIARAALTGTRH